MANHRIVYEVAGELEEIVVHVGQGKSLLTAVAEATGIVASSITIAEAWRKHAQGETQVK